MDDRSSFEATSRVGRLLAALGVIASLVFVGLELRRDVGHAAVRRARIPAFTTPEFASFWRDIRARFDARFVAAFETEYGLE